MLPNDMLATIISFSLKDIEEGNMEVHKNIKSVNNFFHTTYKKFRNQKCFEFCKQHYGFEPPLENAATIVKICAFIRSGGKQTFSDEKLDILIQSAHKTLSACIPADWAYYYLAMLHLNIIKPQSKEKGVDYLIRAAGLGFVPALYALALHYREDSPQKGEFGFSKNLPMMFKFLHMAVEKKHIKAMHVLGIEYLKKGNTDEGFKYLDEAADYDDKDSLIKLARVYRDGSYGVGKDVDRALHYFNRAIDLGSVEAAKELADSYEFGKGCIPKNRGEADKTYRIKYFLELKNRNGEAARQLGLIYLSSKETEKGLKYLEYAVKLKDGIAALKLARLSRENNNSAKAIEYYKIALELLLTKAEQGKYDERNALSECTMDGLWLFTKKEFKLGEAYRSNASRFTPDTSSNVNTISWVP